MDKRGEFETMRCLWWAIIVLERVYNVSYEHNKLPFASQPPSLEDLLPLVPNGNEKSYPVSTDLVTPDMTESCTELFERGFTRLGNFSSTIQATCLSSLLTAHITDTTKSYQEKESVAMKIEAALKSFGCTLIPPPSMADGAYCGAYALRTLLVSLNPFPGLYPEAFTLHEHSLASATSANKPQGIARAKLALRSLCRSIIDLTKLRVIGKPLDFDSLAFWVHAVVAKAAIWHIRLGERDWDWRKRLEVLKTYLRWFRGRAEIYGTSIPFGGKVS
ncbi:hypothetical protein D0Z07_4956 [Hyphodiscus hymeniophilus]|uniref:Transcription factor domain-containing protein n=1 Tax=Hyphodiscus hymeniophilus TaxID=353542 RepID=A0A9P6VJK7_9HELO|nr:hypothetical protein D0Z07_4956 [Hyphodiscus hymeniophilus]